MKRLKGLFTDTQPIDQPEGTYKFAQNIEINSSLGAIVSEKGNEIKGSLNGIVLGNVLLPDGRNIIFVKDSGLKIYSFNGTDITQLAPDGIPVGDYVDAVFNVNEKGQTLIYFTDGENPPRYFNLDDMGKFQTANDFLLSPNMLNYATIEGTIQDTGGNLKVGNYSFAFTYVDDNDNVTNYFNVKGPFFISLDGGGTTEDVTTTKSVRLSISNLDTRYKYLRIVVIPKQNNVIGELQRLSDIPIPSSGTINYTYSGNSTYQPSSLEEILINSVELNKAGSITLQDGQLYIGNVSSPSNIDYQEFAETIKVVGTRKKIENAKATSGGVEIDTGNSYANPNIASKLRTFRADEVYAFYIAFVMKDGSLSRAFHIPGRDAKNISSTKGTGKITINSDYIVVPVPARFRIDYDETIYEIFRTLSTVEDDYSYTFKIQFTMNGNIVETGNIVISAYNDSIDEVKTKVQNAITAISGITLNNDEYSYSNSVGTPVPLSLITFTTPTTTNPNNETVKRLASVFSSNILNSGTTTTGSGGQLQLDFGTTTVNYNITSGMSVATMLNGLDTVINTVTGINALVDGNSIELETENETPTFNGFPKITFVKNGDFPDLAIEVQPITGGNDNIGIDERALIGGIPRYKLHSEVVDDTNMGFWENSNERYGSEFSELLQNQKVRHHKFPEIAYNPYVEGNDYWINGIKLENVQIPIDLKDKILGFKVFYAKRTPENKTIVDSGVVHKSRLKDGVLRSSHSNLSEPQDPNVRYVYPFYSLATRQTLSGVSYIKKTAILMDEKGFFTRGSTFIRPTKLTLVNRITNELFKVQGIGYVNSQVEEVYNSLNLANINKPMLNNRSESKVVVKTEEEWDSSNNYYLCDLLTIPEDVYDSFESQILVDTGYFHPISTDGTYDTDEIYNGDTFINTFVYKTAEKPDGKSEYYVSLNSVVVQSDANIALRSYGDLPWQTFYPKSQSIENVAAMRYKNGKFDFGYDSPPDTEGLTYDNFIGYNPDYSALNDIKPAFPQPQEEIISTFPTRIHRSSTGLRVFKPNDYVDLTRNRGKIVKLAVYNNILIPHLERALVRTKGKEELVIGDSRAFLGSGDIFAVKPDEIIYTKDGFAGIQSIHHGISTPYGYFFVDKQERKIYQLNNDGISEISNNGMYMFFYDNLLMMEPKWAYDPVLKRVILYSDEYTISYYPEMKVWGSFHSYYPHYMFNGYGTFYSVKNSYLWKHHADTYTFYNIPIESIYDFIDNTSASVSKIVDSVTIIGEVKDLNGNVLDTIIDTIQLNTSKQTTGEVPIDTTNNFEYIGNTRRTKNEWNINQFRQVSDVQGEYAWAFKKRIEDKFVEVIMKFNQPARLYIYDVTVNFKPSIR